MVGNNWSPFIIVDHERLTGAGFHTGFFGGGGEVCGAVCVGVREHTAHVLACVQARRVWGHAPPPPPPPQEIFF